MNACPAKSYYETPSGARMTCVLDKHDYLRCHQTPTGLLWNDFRSYR